MRTARRYLVLIALMFWLGGFTFYASIVVPAGTRVLGSTSEQGHITREVTRDLNWTAVFALLPLAWDVLATWNTSRRGSQVRAALWLIMVACQAALFFMHARLDGLMVRADSPEGIDEAVFRAAFRPVHRAYLWTHTVQWFAGVVYIGLMLRAWKAED
jgi:uncharacterized membrane protein